MMKLILSAVLFAVPMLSFAQGGGHVGRHPKQQQQQQQRKSNDEMFVLRYQTVRDDEAAAIYAELLLNEVNKETTLQSCSKEVKELSGKVEKKRYLCFDRGEGFEDGGRYKCYRIKRKYVGVLGWLFLENHIPPACGGDGIHLRSSEEEVEEPQE